MWGAQKPLYKQQAFLSSGSFSLVLAGASRLRMLGYGPQKQTQPRNLPEFSVPGGIRIR